MCSRLLCRAGETRETEKKQRETERAMGGLLGIRSVLLGITLGRASGLGMLERLFEVSIDVQCMLSNFP